MLKKKRTTFEFSPSSEGMTEEEYIIKMKADGYDKRYIDEVIKSIKDDGRRWKNMCQPSFFRRIFHWLIREDLEDWYFPHHPGNC